MPVPQNEKEFKRYRTEVGRIVASELGNSPTIALNSYVAPEVFCAWEATSPLLKKKTWGKQSSQTNELSGTMPPVDTQRGPGSVQSKMDATSPRDATATVKIPPSVLGWTPMSRVGPRDAIPGPAGSAAGPILAALPPRGTNPRECPENWPSGGFLAIGRRATLRLPRPSRGRIQSRTGFVGWRGGTYRNGRE